MFEYMKRRSHLLFLFAGCVLLNVCCSWVCVSFELPFYLDSIGTVLAAVTGGFAPGVAVGYFTNILNTLYDPLSIYYAFISPLFAVAVAYFVKRGMFSRFWKSFVVVPVMTFIGGGSGALITWLLYGFEPGSTSLRYAAILERIFPMSPEASNTLVNFVIDFIDKSFVLCIALVILRFIPRSFLMRFEWSREYLLSKDGRKAECPERNFRRHSLNTRVAAIVGIATLVAGFISLAGAFFLYRGTDYANHERHVSGLSAVVASHLPPDALSGFLETKRKDALYLETEEHIAALKNLFTGIRYLYVYQVREDGNHVIFDFGTPEIPADKLGDVVPPDIDFMKYHARMLRGEANIPPVFSKTSYGTLLTACTPVYDSSGRCAAYAFVDFEMRDVVAGWTVFIVKLSSVLLGLLLVTASFVIAYVKWKIVSPLNAMTSAAREFTGGGHDVLVNVLRRFEALDIRTGDEIETLYVSIRKNFSDFAQTLDFLEESRADEADAKNLLAQILDNLPCCMLAKDARNSFRYVIWNRLIEEHSSYKAEDVIGKTDFEISPYPGCAEKFRKSDEEVYSSGNTLHFEEECVSASGRRFFYNTLKTLIRTSRRELIVELCYDATEEHRLREHLRCAMAEAQNANKAKSAFLATMSHEIRTPLNAVIGFSELLQNPEIPQDERIEYLKSINFAGNALLSLINDILDLSKIESDRLALELSFIDTSTLAQEMKAVFSHKTLEKGIEFRTAFSGYVPCVKMDSLRLRQILLNLLDNAVKYTDKGFVELSVSFQPSGSSRGTLLVCVADSGIGIPAESQASLFQPFTQVDPERDSVVYHGTGLGLAIVSRLVEKMNAKIELASEVGVGSRFSVRFENVEYRDSVPPSGVAAPHDSHDSHLSSDAVSSPSGRRVLIVDDIPMNLKVLSAMLKKIGCIAVSAVSGEEALRLLENEMPNLVLTDMWMPHMGGVELAERIKKRYPDMPVIAVTADAEVQTADSDSFDAVLLKPVTVERLKRTLGRFTAS